MPGDPNQPKPEPGDDIEARTAEVIQSTRAQRLLDDAQLGRDLNRISASLSGLESLAAMADQGKDLGDRTVGAEISRIASKVHSAQLDLGRLLSHATLTATERAFIVCAIEELNTAQKTFSRARGML